jgi:hypothetical protein
MQSWPYEQKIKTNAFDEMRLLRNPFDIDKDKALYFQKALEMLIHRHYSFFYLGSPIM